MKFNQESIHIWLSMIREFMNLYRWLAEAFVLDHFTNSHWQMLPLNWRIFLDQLSPSQLGQWVATGRSNNASSPAPLALQCLRRSADVLSLDRRFKQRAFPDAESPVITEKHRKILNLHVKPKKRHEIWEMSFLIKDLAESCGGIRHIIDVGAGLGHLCRFLSYGLQFETTGIDSDDKLGITASVFNDKIKKNLQKLQKISDTDSTNLKGDSIQRLNKLLEAGDTISHNFEVGLVGLHGCGDLGGIVIENFVQNPQVRFLSFVSCCYMKLNQCFPLSSRLKSNPIDLQYNALELSCHSKEVYIERLSDPEQVNKLKIHCYRAALETVLVKKGFVRTGLRSVKNAHLLGFKEYALKATEKLELDFSDMELGCDNNHKMLEEWMRVVSFYTLRILIAPVIETAVLLDRALFIVENGHSCELLPVFDPFQSPRNIAIIARKETTL